MLTVNVLLFRPERDKGLRQVSHVRLTDRGSATLAGATTLRVYTHFLAAAADRQAAEVLEKTLRRPRRSSSES
jgi:hypothetical protein